MNHDEAVRRIITEVFGKDPSFAVRLGDGTTIGATDAATTLVVRSPDAVRHLVRSPGDLGFGRAYVSGALDVEGDLWALLDHYAQMSELKLPPRLVAELALALGPDALRNPPPIPPEEVDVGSRFRAHTRHRDRTAISHHYDVGNDFYRLVLGPSWTYSCAVFESPHDRLEQAQANKYELICRKLGLRPGMRLLDVGCGWGGMVLHAATHHGVEAVGITISEAQAAMARKRVAEAGLTDRIDIRIQDYRDVTDGPFDAISSIGMFEHVGDEQLLAYFGRLHELLPEQGRLLNHQIGRPARPRRRRRRQPARVHPRGFIQRYVFPDGALHEVGTLVSQMQLMGFEVRHLESLREHYALTLRRWVANLEANWDEAVRLTSEGRARVWRLYMAASALKFTAGQLQIHQILGVKTPVGPGRSGMALRPRWEHDLTRPGSDDGPVIDLRDAAVAPPLPHH